MDFLYYLDESTSIFRGNRSNCFIFVSFFQWKLCKQTKKRQMGRRHLGLYCLPMPHKKDARLIWVNWTFCFLICEFIFFSSLLLCLNQCTKFRPYFTFVKCEQQVGIFSEIGVMTVN